MSKKTITMQVFGETTIKSIEFFIISHLKIIQKKVIHIGTNNFPHFYEELINAMQDLNSFTRRLLVYQIINVYLYTK